MSKIRFSRPTSNYSKPIYKYKEEDFPDLLVDGSVSKLGRAAVWPLSKAGIPLNARVFDNGDIFDGEYDDMGQPAYGTLRFSNGNIYRGPIHYTWPDDYMENTCDVDTEDADWDDEVWAEESWSTPYGKLQFPDGRSFWGVFCFGKM